MINDSGIRVEKAVNVNQILWDAKNKVAAGCIVSEDLGVDDGEGHKIAKAGTPVKGDLENRSEPFTAASGADVTGVLQHDVDVTRGSNNGSALIFGFVDLNKLEADVVAKITDDIKANLPMVKFLR